MQKLLFLVLSTIFYLTTVTEGRKFAKCEFARELSKSGISKTFIPNYVCLANGVSSLDTTAVHKRTATKSELGIFQIRTSECCEKSKKCGLCNIPCEKLLDSNVSDDIQCAKMISEKFGFKYWNGWTTKCKSNDPTNLSKFLPILINCGH